MLIPAALVAVALTAPGQNVPSGPNTPPASPAVTASVTSGDQRRGQQIEGRERTGDRPHTVGLGGQVAVSNRGAGFGSRLFFAERLGVNIDVLWIKHGTRYTSNPQNQGSTFAALPSVIYLFTKPDPSKGVDIRPYVGAGVNYVSASRSTPTTGGTTTLQRRSGTGAQVFGGIEMTFREADWMTVSAEGIYYRLPVNYVNANIVGGFNYILAFHFYLK